MKLPQPLATGTILALCIIGGCAAAGDESLPVRDPEYAIGFYNATGQWLHDVNANWTCRGVPCNDPAGVLRPEADKDFNFEVDPIPETVKLRWRTEDGMLHERAIPFASHVPDPSTFTGVVYFKFVDQADDGVRVIAMSAAERARLARMGMPLIPVEGAEPAASKTSTATSRPAHLNAPAREAATEPATGGAADPAVIFESLKFMHLASIRAELLPLDDYCESSDPATDRFIHAASSLSTGAHRLADAVRARFGKAPLGELRLDFPEAATLLKEYWPDVKESGDPFPAELERASAEIHGDRAVVRFGNDSVALRKRDGRWRAEIPSLGKMAASMGLSGDPNADPDHMARNCRWWASIDQQLAAEVRAGKFQTAAQVGEARSKRQQEAGELLKKNPDLYVPQPPDGK